MMQQANENVGQSIERTLCSSAANAGRRGRCLCRVVIAAGVLGLCASQAAAQFGAAPAEDADIGFEQPKPPAIEDQSGQPGVWGAYLMAVLLGGGAVLLAAMPSQRTHQD